MRKITISLLALLLALPTMAATISGGTKLYLTPNSNWKQSNARFAAYFFGDGEGWASMTKVEGETDLYEVTSPAGKNFTNVIFCRMNPGATTNNWNNKWNQTSDLTYDGTNNHYTVKEGTWDKGGGTWDYYGTSVEVMVGLAYTPTKIFEGDVVTFTANIVNGPADATTTYYVNGVELDGNTWTAVAGNHTASVTVAYGSGSVSDEVSLKVEAVTSSFNVYLEKDGTWAAANIYYWGDASNSWPGEEMKTTTVNEVEYFYYTFRNVKTVNIIFNSNNVQTEDINNVTGEQFYKLGAKSGSKYTVTTGGSTTDPEPETGLTYNVTVPEGTPGCFIAGEMNGWSHQEMTKVDDTHYTITIAGATTAMKYKYAATAGWDNVEVQANGTDVADRTYSENDVVAAWKGISVSPEAETLVYNVTVPEGTPACYIVGDMTSWSFVAMTKVDDTHYTITYDNVTKATAYKYACGEDWAYVEKGANGEELQNRTYTENDVVAKWAAVPVVEPETETLVYNVTVPAGTPACYIVGAFNDWGVFEPMTKVDDTHYTITIENVTKATEYKYTCGEHWDYVEALENNRTWSESDVVTAWAKVPFVGLVYNVTVPEGTPGCFIAGEMNDWAFTEMEKVDDTHYTIAIANATNAMKYKYAATASWDNVEIQANGADVENRSYSENDVVEAWKGISVSPEAETLVYNVTVPEGTPACYIVGDMNGWSFTAMTKVDDTHYTITYDNVTKATAYKYTCGEDWAYVEKGANGEELQNRTYSENDVVAKWAAIPEVTPEPTTLTYNVEVPVGTEKCFIAGEMNGWTFTEMEMVDATHYTITLDNVTTATEYKYACGNGWEYVETQADGNDVANRTWCENDVVVRWKNTWTNVSDIIANSLKVYGVNDAIRVTAAEATTLYIYNAQGQLIMTTLVNGDETIALTQGLYIVNNNKVLVY